MADSGRLDELLRKFDENPRRYFAPLANEYRKDGKFEQAIELCRIYLPQQPNHMSGYIVYGQALYDAGRGEEAAKIFRRALELDPENVIALRYLGDIAREGGEQEEATAWYERVLELEPRNEEVAGYVAQLRSADTGTLDVPPGQPEPAEEFVKPRATVHPEPPAEAEVVALADLVTQPETIAPSLVVPPEETAQEETAQTIGEDQQHTPDLMGVAESEDTSVSLPSIAEFATTVQTVETLFSAGPVPEEGVPENGVPEDSEPGEDRAPRTNGGNLNAPFVTETMADLYLRQGLKQDALAVYRRLAEERGEARFHKQVEQLEQDLAEQVESQPLELGPAEPPVVDAVSVRDFFARIGARRPGNSAAPGASDAAAHSGALPEPPAIPPDALQPLAPPPETSEATNPGSLDTLFARAPLSDADLRAAASLARAYGAPE